MIFDFPKIVLINLLFQLVLPQPAIELKTTTIKYQRSKLIPTQTWFKFFCETCPLMHNCYRPAGYNFKT